ncbi:N(6)-L-threonylcarbamoyladenine synthase Kae1, partial [candidate division WOR-3 bacterium]|nr:N(6)-L-threonylcarbamoyladenine synthase Kae1 [candidate division WOR-3 bacterium]
AHTFGVGIVDKKGKILANTKASFRSKGTGIKPQEASAFLIKNVPKVIENALSVAGLKAKDIDIFAFARGPGLGPCLKVGATSARTLALIHKKPLIPVNHCIAHIEIGKLVTGAKDPVVVYVSGGNTQIIALEKKHYRVFGETLDIGLGNMLDSFGRKLGFGFPAGPKLDEMYFAGKQYIKLPYTVKGTDLAFAGLQTAAENLIGKAGKEDLAYSLLHTAFAMLTEVSERALAYTEKKEVLLVGGVASSRALRKMLQKMCEDRNAKLFVPKKEFCVDNGAMIAWLGLLVHKHRNSKHALRNTWVKQKLRIEDTEISW